MTATALIAEDEPLLLASLRKQLREAWPDLRIVAKGKTLLPIHAADDLYIFVLPKGVIRAERHVHGAATHCHAPHPRLGAPSPRSGPARGPVG